MRKYLLIVLVLSLNYVAAFAQTLSSQTKTANLFNSFSEAFLNLWAQYSPQYVAANDNIYAYSQKLSPHRGSLVLVLRDFHFDIPSTATIQNITVKARRFKSGKGSVRDYFATLIREPVTTGAGTPYGVRWINGTNYSNVETEDAYQQSGSGNNGGTTADQAYQWTSLLINDPAFGVRIDTYGPEGGSAVVYYDQVTIAVEYSEQATIATRQPRQMQGEKFKEPSIYPNPFASTTTIRFTANEPGPASVDLYNLRGERIRALFSGNVIRGQLYNIIAGDGQLPKGIYVYRITNGKQSQTGRIIKLE